MDSSNVSQVLKEYFQHTSLKPGQYDAVQAIAAGRDVFVRMGTGSGKSMCMFLPPLCSTDVSAMAVIVSPLTGLMEQQAEQIRKAGLSAIIATSSNYDVGSYRYLFISPELVTKPPWISFFTSKFAKDHLVLVAVDEAHCIIDWGKSFRPAFVTIGGLKALTRVPFMALTATASEEVQSSIESSLQLVNPVIVSQPLDRPNILLSIAPIKALTRDLGGVVQLLQAFPEYVPKILVFVQTKNVACKVYSTLSTAASHKSMVGMYHASLTAKMKEQVREDFRGSTHLRCLVATVAFGMGMDIRDIRVVVVYGAPGGMNELHQLCGRAGRDGNSSRAHIYYSQKKKMDDLMKIFFLDKENCRRQSMLASIGSSETISKRGHCCDVCNPVQVRNHILSLDSPGPVRKPRRQRIRTVSSDVQVQQLKKSIQSIRQTFLDEHPDFRMLGPDIVLPRVAVESLCADIGFISSADYIKSHFNIRTELCKDLYSAVCNVFS